RVYIYCADTLYEEGLIPIIQGADLVYHETTYMESEQTRATLRYHSTTVQAASLAQKAQIKRLLIGHFSSRYEQIEPFLQECIPIFPNTELALEGVSFLIGANQEDLT
ncbi:MAG: MBL fold metallo-hydrolase, partial [Chitinophagaceae bacterium]